MSDFKDDINWNIALSDLREACKYRVLELQLVWMFEIITILLFQINIGSKLVRRLDGAYRLTHKGVIQLASQVGVREGTLGRLSEYRDTFVHFGYLRAKPLLLEFLEYVTVEELDNLMQVSEVTLNLRNGLL